MLNSPARPKHTFFPPYAASFSQAFEIIPDSQASESQLLLSPSRTLTDEIKRSKGGPLQVYPLPNSDIEKGASEERIPDSQEVTQQEVVPTSQCLIENDMSTSDFHTLGSRTKRNRLEPLSLGLPIRISSFYIVQYHLTTPHSLWPTY